MPDLSLSGALPAGDGNGLAKIAGDLVRNPRKVHVAVMLVDSPKTVINNDTGDAVPVVRIRRVEVVLRKDLAAAERLLRRAMEDRTGQTVMDMDLEDEISEAFKDIEAELGTDPKGDDGNGGRPPFSHGE